MVDLRLLIHRSIMVDSKPSVRIWIVVGLSFVAHSGCMFVIGRVAHWINVVVSIPAVHLCALVVSYTMVHFLWLVVSTTMVHFYTLFALCVLVHFSHMVV